MAIDERLVAAAGPATRAAIRPADVTAHLLGRRGDARHRRPLLSLTAAISPIGENFRLTGHADRSGPTMIRPARSCSAPIHSAAGEAFDASGPDDGGRIDTVAAEHDAARTAIGHLGADLRPRRPCLPALASHSATDLRQSGSMRGPASIRTMREARGSMRRKSCRKVPLATSAIAPAISTPVGPPPTTRR